MLLVNSLNLPTTLLIYRTKTLITAKDGFKKLFGGNAKLAVYGQKILSAS